MVPGTVYGITDPQNVAIAYNDISKAIFTPESYIVNLEVDGKVESTILREMQFHPVTDKVLHVDLLRVDEENAVVVELPVKILGVAAGVLAGGKLVPLTRRIKVRGIAKQLPDFVGVDVTELELGSTVTVGSAGIEGLDIVSPSSTGIAMVDIPRAVRQELNEDGTEVTPEAAAPAAAE
ncbi:UNVERIFIED_CONTAM: hypothetical protein GTU68_012459 [Idotea baltica]|nr:hypothetical protein [Idotea baltica]